MDKVTFTTLRVSVRRTERALRHYQEMCAERDRVIVALLAQGNTTRTVAAAAGLTQGRVVQIHTAATMAAEAENEAQEAQEADLVETLPRASVDVAAD